MEKIIVNCGLMGLRGQQPYAVQKAIAWFKENGLESSLQACVDATGVSGGTARNARRQLKNAGLLPEIFSMNHPGAGSAPVRKVEIPHVPQATPRPVGATPPPAPLSAQSLDDLENELGRPLSKLPLKDALTRAWEIHDRSNSEQIKVATLRIIASLSTPQESKRDLGPGPPLTLADRLHRGALVLQACGRENAGVVWRAAFNEEIVGTNVLPPVVVEDDIPGGVLPELPAPDPGAPTIVSLATE